MRINMIILLLFTSFLVVISCDRLNCTNNNPIFEKNSPDSKLYKDELVKRLNNIDKTELTCWLQKYDQQDGKESLYFHIQGDGLCAILHLNVNDWSKLEVVRERKGIGRRGAEFTNLKFKIIKDSILTKFIYKTFDRIID